METDEQKLSEEELVNKVNYLENEKKKLTDEFDLQRAKMKELFLQKEVELTKKNDENIKLKQDVNVLQKELDDLKSQLVVAGLTLESTFEVEKRKADEEIASLQKIVCETVEESSSSKTSFDLEIKNLQTFIYKLQSEITELKKLKSPQHSSQEPNSLAPGLMLSAVTKKIVKKFDAFSSPDNAEDIKEPDVEVLNSLYVPFEEEIKALKDKLRSTDELLQKCRQCGHFPEKKEQESSNTVDLSAVDKENNDVVKNLSKQSCDMCSNYEAELVKEQQRVAQLEAKVVAAEKAAEKNRDDLIKEIGFRKDMEEKWSEKKEEHKKQVAELTTRTECAEQDLKELQQTFNQTCEEIRITLAQLTKERESVYQELQRLQVDNDYLVGKYTVHSQELQSEVIDLPDKVDELYELVLKNHQELIIAKIAKEAAEEKVNTLRSDIMLLKDQIANDQQTRDSLENNLASEIDLLKEQIYTLEKDKKRCLQNCEELHSAKLIHEERANELNAKFKEVTELKKHLEAQINELKTRVAALQQELDTSEAVQKDFVRLSQSLQVQLEKIRASDTQVRWQHEEDVEDCQSCKSQFGATKRKQHCRHCGQIFCLNCLSHTVLSGPNQTPSKVCDVCHTLLVKSSAPYFSTEAPHSPD